jgi:hypothetical protein
LAVFPAISASLKGPNVSSLLQQSTFDELVAAPPLTEADLTGTFWAFGQLGRRLYASFMVLAPGGRIGNYRHDRLRLGACHRW